MPIASPEAAVISARPPARPTAAAPDSASASSRAACCQRAGDYRIDEGVPASPQGCHFVQGVPAASRLQGASPSAQGGRSTTTILLVLLPPESAQRTPPPEGAQRPAPP